MSIEFVHRNDEARLRDSISQLKTIRASVQSTLVEVEAIHSELAVGNFPTSQATKTRLRQLELEEAVMRQGLKFSLQAALDIRGFVIRGFDYSRTISPRITRENSQF
jgi:hypothetical protein